MSGLYESLDNTQLTVLAAAATVVGAAAVVMMRGEGNKKKGTIDPNHQSIELEPGMRTSTLAPDGKPVDFMFEDAKTLHECFLRGLRVSDNGPCLGVKTGANEFSWISYKEVLDRATNIGCGLVAKGNVTGEASKIGIYSANCVEWVATEQACSMFSMVVVPLYDTLGTEACSYIINQTEMETVFVDKAEKAVALLKAADTTPSLKRVVVFESIANNNFEEAEKRDIEVIHIKDLEALGQDNSVPLVTPKSSDLCTICYTSGTTGDPKGVMLTHGNIIADLCAVLLAAELAYIPGEHAAGGTVKVGPNDIHISYLPLAHMMERIVQTFLFMNGSKIGFFGGDVRKLLDDIAVLKPTIFVTVPRLLNRIYDKVLQGAASASLIKRCIFNLAYKRKLALLRSGVVTKDSIWDKIVFGKIQAMLGGRVNFVITGSAPLSSAVLDFTRCAFGCEVYEGYGQTECAAAGTITIPNEKESGHVGPPLPCNVIKLIDVPEMEYFVKDNKGEVCFKGTNVMKGYYKDQKKTDEAIDSEGWLHSGDVGQWLPNGTLKIIDRRKHIFKLAQGEYLAPEKIENIYIQTPLVAQCFVDGHSLEMFAVAVVVPDPEVVPQWAEKNGISGSMEELCKNEKLIETIKADLIKKGKEAGLKGFEQAREIYLYPELFSSENGLLTPTFKAKRPVLRTFFAKQITALYGKANDKA